MGQLWSSVWEIEVYQDVDARIGLFIATLGEAESGKRRLSGQIKPGHGSSGLLSGGGVT